VAEAQGRIADQEKRKAGMKGGAPQVKDPAGNLRYTGEQLHVDQLLDVHLPPKEAPAEGEEPVPVPAKVLCRNTQIKCIDLTMNFISSRAAVEDMQPWGYKAPSLLLRQNPVAESIRAAPFPEPAARPELDIVLGWAVDVGAEKPRAD
jgi:hypothetical protein